MKRIEIKSIDEFIRTVNLSKCSRDTAMRLLRIHLALYGENRVTEDKAQEAYRSVFSGQDEERLRALMELRNRYHRAKDDGERAAVHAEIGNSYGDIIELEQRLNSVHEDMLGEEVALDFEKIALADLLDALADSGTACTASHIDMLMPIIER